MNIDEEQKLVAEAKTSSEAFSRLYEYYFPKVYGFVGAQIRQRETAEDLVSEAFMKILVNIPKYEFRGVPFAAWVFRIVRNVLKDYYKSSGKKQALPIDEALPIKDESPDVCPNNQAIKQELRGRVKNVLKTLPLKESEVVHLKFFCELNNREIANTLEMTESNVGVILFRTLNKIKPELANLI